MIKTFKLLYFYILQFTITKSIEELLPSPLNIICFSYRYLDVLKLMNFTIEDFFVVML